MIGVAFLAAWLMLGVLQPVYHSDHPVLAAVLTLPIATMAIFLRPQQPRRLLVATVVSLPYFVHGVMAWTIQTQPFLAAAEVGLCTVLYVLLIVDGAHRRSRFER